MMKRFAVAILSWLMLAHVTLAAPALDGSDRNAAGAGTTIAVTGLSTAGAGVVVCIFESNGAPFVSVTATGLTFTKYAEAGVSPNQIAVYIATSSGAFAATITGTATSSAFQSMTCFGVSGTYTAGTDPQRWDPNGALPALSNSGLVSLTTTNANDFLFCAYRITSGTNGAGWTNITNGGGTFQLVQYQVVAATQTALSCDVGTPIGINGSIGAALTADAPAGGGAVTRKSLMGAGK